jgi:hypothetical protein
MAWWTPTSGALHAQQRMGWQPTRFLTDRAEAERAFALAEQLGSVNAAAAELGTTWPSLRKAFARHGLGMSARNPQTVRQRAIEAARKRTGRPATPSLTRGWWRSTMASCPCGHARVGSWPSGCAVPREYAVLGARVVVELHSDSHAAKPSVRAWAITRRADRVHRQADREQRSERHRPAAPAAPTGPTNPTDPRRGGWLPMSADPIRPTNSTARRGFAPT